MRTRLPVTVSVLLAASGALLSGTQVPRFTSRVEAVRVDVLVTDAGRPVEGLTAEDFDVRDSGVRQRVTLVSYEQIPLNVMLLFDLSGSVQGTRVADLRAAGRALIDDLRPDDQAGLMTFTHVVTRRQALTTDLARVRAALDAAGPNGRTSLIDGLHAAVTLTESDLRRALVMVFSDGLDTASWLTEAQVLESVRRSEAVVYGVAVGQRRYGPRFLHDAAEASGGRLIDVETTENLDDVFVSTLDEFRQRYLISYTPTGVDAAGWHPLQVRVRRRGVDVRARSGYYRDN